MIINWEVLSADDANRTIIVRYTCGELQRDLMLMPGELSIEDAIARGAPTYWFRIQLMPPTPLTPAVGMTGTLET